MSKLPAYIEFAIDLAVAYQRMRKRRTARFVAEIALLVLAGVMVLTAIGLGLAAAYWAMIALGSSIAGLLTGVIALATAGAALLASRWLGPPKKG